MERAPKPSGAAFRKRRKEEEEEDKLAQSEVCNFKELLKH